MMGEEWGRMGEGRETGSVMGKDGVEGWRSDGILWEVDWGLLQTGGLLGQLTVVSARSSLNASPSTVTFLSLVPWW